MSAGRPRVAVAGTKFGRVYLAAFREPSFPLQLSAVLARGSDRSRRIASAHGVPLCESAGSLPEVDMAAVVIGGALNGGPGTDITLELLEHGIPVLQEHPLHHDELAACLRQAQTSGTSFRLNTHIPHVEPVRRFVHAARTLLETTAPVAIDARCSFQVLHSLMDIIGQVLGGLRPWQIDPASRGPAAARTVTGTVAGTPLTLVVQQQVDPRRPDNGGTLWHRVALSTDAGTLTLVNTHGPILWCPRPHLPSDSDALLDLAAASSQGLDAPTSEAVGPATAPSQREVLATLWPSAADRAMVELWQAHRDGVDSRPSGQYHLALCRLVQATQAAAGAVEMVCATEPPTIDAGRLLDGFPGDPGGVGALADLVGT